MVTYKQNGRTITAVIERKPYILTCKTAEQLASIKADLEKIGTTKSEKVIKTLTTKLLKQFQPKVIETEKAKDKKVAELKGKKKIAKKQAKEETKGRSKSSSKAKEALANVVSTDVVVAAEEKLEQAIEVSKKVEVKPSVTGVRRAGEY
jgi:hypothetical protein